MADVIDAAGRARVKAAIAEAEAHTRGEIFVVVAESSDDYASVPLLWAALAALVLPAPLIFLTALPASLIYLSELVAFLVVALALSPAPIRALAVPRPTKHAAAHALAVEQFLAQGLTTTEARTGVLIFVSIMERYAEIIADTGIAARVGQAVWDDAMAGLVGAVRAGRLADGLERTIVACGAVLAEHFPGSSRDRNEIPDDLVVLPAAGPR